MTKNLIRNIGTAIVLLMLTPIFGAYFVVTIGSALAGDWGWTLVFVSIPVGVILFYKVANRAFAWFDSLPERRAKP